MSTIKSAKKRILKEVENYCIKHHLPLYAEISGQNQTYFINLYEKNYNNSFFNPSFPIKKTQITKNELRNLHHEKIHKIISEIFDDDKVLEKFENRDEEEFHPGFGVKNER